PDLAAVAGIDQPGRVHDGEPVPRREAGAGLHEARVPVGNRDGETRAHRRPLPRAKLVPVARGQVEPRVSRVGAFGQDRVLPQAADGQLDHALERASDSDSATRYRANRRTSRIGRWARMKTPSSRSARSSTGIPSAYSSASRPPSS